MLSDHEGGDDRAQLSELRTELRYRAVLEVRDGQPVNEVAVRYGVTRQSVTTWRRRYEQFGLDGLNERSRRPHHSPNQISAEIEALVCELRRVHRRWGARRIVFELDQRGVVPTPSRATAHRILVRNGLVRPQEQHRKRRYKRWQREAPMHLWQLDLVGGVFLTDGRECKILTGIDDHSRFVVIATVLERPSGTAVVEAFVAAMGTYGVPFEVLSDNGKQFTGRFTRPLPAEVLFERTCREYGINQRLTKRRSPTTTGKIERWHQTLRRELLDEVGAFPDIATAQAAIDAWVQTYNRNRPHQSLDMATPASLFRARTTNSAEVEAPVLARTAATSPATTAAHSEEPRAIEWDTVVPGTGVISLVGHQQIWLGRAFASRNVTVWADVRTVHVLLEEHHIKTVASRLSATHLQQLTLRGARPAGPAPAAPALPPGTQLPPTVAIEVERTVTRDGHVQLAGHTLKLGPQLAGTRVVLRLQDQLVHAIADNRLVKTLPSPIEPDQRANLTGARRTNTPLPPRPPTGPIHVERRVPTNGQIMIARQRLQVGRLHAGKTVTIAVEDTHFRILHGTEELAVHPRTTTAPIRHFKAPAPRMTHHGKASPDDTRETIS